MSVYVCMYVYGHLFAGDDKAVPVYSPAHGEIPAFVKDIVRKEMGSVKGDLEKYFKSVCGYSLIDCVRPVLPIVSMF